MELLCNGKKQSLDDGSTVETLLGLLNLEPATVVVEVNRQIIEVENYATLNLKDGDTVELIRFVGGG